MKILHFAFSILLLAGCSGEAADTSPADRAGGARIAAGGLTEPVGEERVIIPQISGRLARVAIEEGDSVEAGQVIAEIENADLRADVSATEAEVALREAELARLRNGARAEEIEQGRAALAAADASLRLATVAAERTAMMFTRKQVSAQQNDQAQAELSRARAARAESAAALKLLQIGSRAEDLRAAEARLSAAQANHARAKAVFEKSLIRSPVAGIVLKRDLREGETVVALSPRPLARIGDLSRLQVRADIDELDIGRVKVGQLAEVSSDAVPGQTFRGRVTQVSRRMGGRTVHSDDPAEKLDARILEAVILLDADVHLPVGLRVDVFIDTRATAP